MNIENHKRGYMSATGSSILNGLTPVLSMLDLFVRESIQNSYDAMIDGENYINIEFFSGNFDDEKLPQYFEGIEHKLRNLEKGKYKFISVRDSNTTGLVGPTTMSEVDESNDWGKFINLVKNFAKSNKLEGAGGSYGHGKSNYYKIGNGLVIYYTRVKLNDSNYEERLMGCVVEHEKNKEGLVYEIQKGVNTGIAWWGRQIDDECHPLTNGDEISQILDCFKIRRYINEETGTTVIIPYVDEEMILKNTLPEKLNDCGGWCKSIESYLKIATQRWYPTRYENAISGQKYIKVFINGISQTNKEMYPLFDVIRHLYNKNFNNTYETDFEIKCEEIRVFKFFNENLIANFYFCLLDENDLKMTVPNNNESPFSQINNSILPTVDQNKIIISYCRKPGMILQYDIDGDWSTGIVSPDPNKYLIGLIIPKTNIFSDLIDSKGNTKRLSLEEILRSSEGPEHTEWTNINSYSFDDGSKVDISNFEVVTKMRKSIRNKMKKYIQEKNDKTSQMIGTALNRKLAELFLPKTGFGTKSSLTPINPKSTRDSSTNSKQKSKLQLGNLQCDENNNLYKKFYLNIKNVDINPIYEFKVVTDNTIEEANTWEETAAMFPLEILSITIDKIIDKNNSIREMNLNMNNDFNSPTISMQRKLTNIHKVWYGFSICANDGDILTIEGKITYKYNDKTISTSLVRVGVK